MTPRSKMIVVLVVIMSLTAAAVLPLAMGSGILAGTLSSFAAASLALLVHRMTKVLMVGDPVVVTTKTSTWTGEIAAVGPTLCAVAILPQDESATETHRVVLRDEMRKL